MLSFHLNSQAIIRFFVQHHKSIVSTLIYSPSPFLSLALHVVIWNLQASFSIIPFELLQHHFHYIYSLFSVAQQWIASIRMDKRSNYISVERVNEKKRRRQKCGKFSTSTVRFYCNFCVTTVFNRYFRGASSIIITTIYITISVVVTIISNFTILSLVAIIRWFYQLFFSPSSPFCCCTFFSLFSLLLLLL